MRRGFKIPAQPNRPLRRAWSQLLEDVFQPGDRFRGWGGIWPLTTVRTRSRLSTYGAFAEVFSQVLGRPIAYIGITAESGRAGHQSAQHAGLAGGASRQQRQARRGRRLFDREHQADRGSGRARADHDQTIRGGFQGIIQLSLQLELHETYGASRLDYPRGKHDDALQAVALACMAKNVQWALARWRDLGRR
jgi:hypothetical protein